MNSPNLLVHTIDNNLDNIDALIFGATLGKAQINQDAIRTLSEIIQDQMNKVLENAELYYLEDSNCAKNKEQVLLLEFIHYVYNFIIDNCTQPISLIVPQKIRGIDIEMDEQSIHKMSKILNYLTVTSIPNVHDVELMSLDSQVHIKINLEKIQEQGLQIK